ncbi:MAG: CdaR family protein [Defluviitaleaceae bacterium]|nr:CdaR family protein [Defluviitaleaceae bacterium]
MDSFLSKLKEVFVTNLPLKIGAVLIALAIWFLILNFQDPVRTQELFVRLYLRNENELVGSQHQFFLENAEQLRNQIITVQVRGNNADVQAFEESLVAYIDLSTDRIIQTAAEGRGEINTMVNVMGNFGDRVDFRSHSPSTVTLYLDNIITREFDVDFVVAGQVADGYVLVEERYTISPDALTLQGPSSLLAQIDRLVLEVDVEGQTGTIQRNNQRPIAVNEDGDGITSHDIRIIGGVAVTVPIYRGGVVNILPPTHEGGLGVGFGVLPIHITPSQFYVAGSGDAIEGLTSITLPPIVMDGATESFTREFDISRHLPAGVFLLDSTQNIATAEVVIEPIRQREFTVARENVNIIGAPSNFQILTDNVTFTISALESVLAGIGNINTSINLIGRGEGEHTINLNVNLPSGASIVGSTPALVVHIGNNQENNNLPPDDADETDTQEYPDEIEPEPEPDEENPQDDEGDSDDETEGD